MDMHGSQPTDPPRYIDRRTHLIQHSTPNPPYPRRQKAGAFAKETVDRQRASFRRYGVWGDWDEPYMTLQPEYEAAQIRVFGDMVLKVGWLVGVLVGWLCDGVLFVGGEGGGLMGGLDSWREPRRLWLVGR